METFVTAPEIVQQPARAVIGSPVDRTIDKLARPRTALAAEENLFNNVELLDAFVHNGVDGKASALAG